MKNNKYVSYFVLGILILGFICLYIEYTYNCNLSGILAGIFLSTALNYFCIIKFIEYFNNKENKNRIFNIKNFIVMEYLKQLILDANCLSSKGSEKILKYNDIIMYPNKILSYIDILSKELEKEQYGLAQIENLKIHLAQMDIARIKDEVSTILILTDETSALDWRLICNTIGQLKDNTDQSRYGNLLLQMLKLIKNFLQS